MSKVSAFSVVALGVAMISGDVPLKADGLKLTILDGARAHTAGAVYGGADVRYKGSNIVLNQPVRERSPISKLGDFSKGIAGGVAGVAGGVGRAVSAPGRLIGDAFKKAADSESGLQSSVRTPASEPRSRSDSAWEKPSRNPNPPVLNTKSWRNYIAALEEEDRQARTDKSMAYLESTYRRQEPSQVQPSGPTREEINVWKQVVKRYVAVKLDWRVDSVEFNNYVRRLDTLDDISLRAEYLDAFYGRLELDRDDYNGTIKPKKVRSERDPKYGVQTNGTFKSVWG